jgi:Domain of unknown function (DUF397)
MSPDQIRQAAQPAFRRASFCGATECIEVAQREGKVVIRDSTQPHGSMLYYAARDWGSFVHSIKSGQLDGLGS